MDEDYVVVSESDESLSAALDALQDDMAQLNVASYLGGVSIICCPDHDGVMLFHAAQAVLIWSKAA